jgi:PAS domain-containing protein
MSDAGAVRRWTRVVAGLRSRRSKLRGPALPAGSPLDELLGESIETCGGLLQDLAGVQLLADQLRHDLHTESLNRQYLLDQVPVACVTTDDASVIHYANQPAAELLNVSAKHLRGRLLLHFSEDRAGFGDLLQKLPLTGGRLDVSLAVRPRERGPFALTALIVPETTSQRTSWLWFLNPVANERSATPAIGRLDAKREIA